MIERQHRTLICSVLFLDMVGYSRKPVTQQMNLRESFNRLLREALEGVARNDRVILDTGDGAAVTFLGDPEGALFLALRLRESLSADSLREEQDLRLRCGINLGPVKLVRDINGQPNIIGDGINVAQRIMGFAEPAQVLVARSYFEVVSRLSDDYAHLFRYEGSRTDKHVREHEVYAVSGYCPLPARRLDAARNAQSASRVRAWLVGIAQHVGHRLHAKPLLTTALAATAILAVGAVVRTSRDVPTAAFAVSAYPPPAAGSPGKPAVALTSISATAVAESPIPMAEALPVEAPPKRIPEAMPESGSAAKARKVAPKTRASVVYAPAGDNVGPLASAPVNTDTLIDISIAALPWGEVYVDGVLRGVSPPLRALQLPAGSHRIEFRNTTFPSYVGTINVQAGDHLTIRHRFQAGESH